MSSDNTRTEATQPSREERLAIVEEHVQQENQHDLDGIMATFGEDAWYEDEAIGEHHEGRDSVRDYYDDLLHALPDFHIDINRRHVTEDHVILEVTISGTHEGNWRGLPGTGQEVEWDTCAVFAFDDQNKLAGERIYYDRASLLRQLGIFHEPEKGIGQVLTLLLHPVTFGRALARPIERVIRREKPESDASTGDDAC
jgi:steroid delta-isomerase-like uncharacterized protein